MKNLLLFAVISISVILNSGCASKFMSFEKRKYNKGYHVDFADKKNKKTSAGHSEEVVIADHQETKELASATDDTASQQVSAVSSNHQFVSEETASVVSEEETKSEATPQKKKAFQNPLFKNINSKKITATAKHSIEKLMPKKNIAGTNQTLGTSFFTILGAIIGGGCLVALGVMIFSNWASITLMIVFLCGALLGLILLIIGANS